MWISLFTVVLAIALGFGLGACFWNPSSKPAFTGASACVILVRFIGSDPLGGQEAAQFFCTPGRLSATELCHNIETCRRP